MSTHTFRTQEKDTIVEDCLALVGRMSKTELINTSLHLLYEKLKGEQYVPYCLPNPKVFENKLRILSDEAITLYIIETSRLHNIAKWVETDRKSAAKKRKEILK